MSKYSTSLIIRICDFLECPYTTIGGLLGFAPTHHIVMENILYGQEESDKRENVQWETWDLKPTSYFFPERDIAGGMLTSEATKSRLADKFKDKIVLKKEQADDFLRQLSEDTAFLAKCNTVDYSLFLVRIRTNAEDPLADPSLEDHVIPSDPPFAPPPPPSWRTGFPSSDGQNVFRAAILDFFWAKHKVQPILMTWLVKMWNLVNRQGPMTITTTPDEYRSRFLQMCEDIVQVH